MDGRHERGEQELGRLDDHHRISERRGCLPGSAPPLEPPTYGPQNRKCSGKPRATLRSTWRSLRILGAKLLLVGDPRQLAAVGPGGADPAAYFSGVAGVAGRAAARCRDEVAAGACRRSYAPNALGNVRDVHPPCR